jgi:uncharacterized membrane protein YbjE (DUF340 family)
MKFALLVGATLALGLLAGRVDLLPWLSSDVGTYVLFVMIFLVLFTAGGDRRTYELIRTQGARLLLVPAATVAGNLLGVALLAVFYDGLGFRQILAVGSGFGYYTFASVFIQEMEGPTVGAIALVANVLREVATLLLAPAVFRYLGGNACVAMGGATVSDSTLPIIAKACGKEIVPVAFVSGLIITIIVPFLLMAILS